MGHPCSALRLLTATRCTQMKHLPSAVAAVRPLSLSGLLAGDVTSNDGEHETKKKEELSSMWQEEICFVFI